VAEGRGKAHGQLARPQQEPRDRDRLTQAALRR
jgi:hypothetical protein